jgi:hypothetical protein
MLGGSGSALDVSDRNTVLDLVSYRGVPEGDSEAFLTARRDRNAAPARIGWFDRHTARFLTGRQTVPVQSARFVALLLLAVALASVGACAWTRPRHLRCRPISARSSVPTYSRA